MSLFVAGFDWNDANRAKCQKHGVTIDEIETLFRHPFHSFPDPAHSHDEQRSIAIGTGSGKRPVFLVFTLRDVSGALLIRPISARYMHRKEIENYEEAIARSAH